MNILYICDEYPPGKTGGIGSVVANLARGLSAKGHNIFVVGLYAHGYGGPDTEERDHLFVRRFRYFTDIGIIGDNDNLKDKLMVHGLRRSGILRIDAAIQLRRMFRFIRELVKTQNIDVIEMPDWNNFYFNAGLHSMQIPDMGAPVIVKMHGTASYFNKEMNLPISKRMFLRENYVVRRADALCAVSDYTGKVCKDLYKIDSPIQVLHNSVELQKYHSSAERLNTGHVIFTGSLFKKKGIYSLVKVWNKVVSKVPNARLHIYGKGNTSLLKSLIDKNAEETVFFHGHVPHCKLIASLKEADLAVFPSYSETFGLGVVEAMSTGCPVIYTSRSCGPEIVADGEEGLLADPDNEEMLMTVIVTLLQNQTLRERYGKSGYEKVKMKFERENSLNAHLRFYERVISGYRGLSDQINDK